MAAVAEKRMDVSLWWISLQIAAVLFAIEGAL